MDIFFILKILLQSFHIYLNVLTINLCSSINYCIKCSLLFFSNLIIFIIKTTCIASQSKFHRERRRKNPSCFSRDVNSDERIFRVSSARRSRAEFRALFRHEIGRFLPRSRHDRTERTLENEARWKERERRKKIRWRGRDEGPEEQRYPPGWIWCK